MGQTEHPQIIHPREEQANSTQKCPEINLPDLQAGVRQIANHSSTTPTTTGKKQSTDAWLHWSLQQQKCLIKLPFITSNRHKTSDNKAVCSTFRHLIWRIMKYNTSQIAAENQHLTQRHVLQFTGRWNVKSPKYDILMAVCAAEVTEVWCSLF